MSRITRVRGAIDDIFWASRRVVEPIIYLPSFAKPTRRAFNRRAQTEVSRVMEEAAYPSDNRGKRGKYPCRGLDLRTALYDCNQRHLYIGGCTEIDKCNPDPSFENQVADWGGGPNGNEIPIFADFFGVFLGQLIWPSDESPVAPNDTYYAQFQHSTTTEDSYWKVSTASPRTGTNHLIATAASVGSEAAPSALLISNIKKCSPVLGEDGSGWMSVYVSAGETISPSYYAKTDNLGGGTLTGSFFVTWHDAAGNAISSATFGSTSLGTAYTLVSGTSAAAPANTAYAVLYATIGPFNGTDPGHTSSVYIDDFTLTSGQAPEGIRDPGVENHVSVTSRTELPWTKYWPLLNGGGGLWWLSDNSDAIESGSGFAQRYPQPFVSQTLGEPWVVSTADPDTGTYHLRSGPSDQLRNGIIILGFVSCLTDNGERIPLSGPCSPGQSVTISARGKSSVSTASNQTLNGGIWYLDNKGAILSSSSGGGIQLTSAYSTYSFTSLVSAPATTAYILVSFVISMNAGQEVRTFDLDNFNVVVT